jgi:ketol-acid reductoisomerase
MKNVTIIGAGSMGTALSILLSNNGHRIKIWSPFEDEAQMLNEAREHKEKLPGVKIPEDVTCTTDLEEALFDTELVTLVIPSQTIRENIRSMKRYLKKGQKILDEIQRGEFASRWIAENKAGGRAQFLATRRKEAEHEVEVVGAKLRKMMSWLKK